MVKLILGTSSLGSSQGASEFSSQMKGLYFFLLSFIGKVLLSPKNSFKVSFFFSQFKVVGLFLMKLIFLPTKSPLGTTI